MPAGLAVVRVLLFVALQAAQPAAPLPAGLILGRVVDAAGGRPVSGAIVTLAGLVPIAATAPGGAPTSPQPRAMTNANGQFVFRNLPKGSFSLNVTRSGYLDGAYGRQRPGGPATNVPLDEGQRVGDVVIRMWRPAVITGTVSDEAGEPLVGVSVRAFRRMFISGKRRFMPAGVANTDDRGMYRFTTLTPGEYLLAFLSREVTVPAAFEDIRGAATNPNDKTAQALMRGTSAIGAFGGSPSSGDGMQIGDTVRQISMMGPVPPISPDTDAPTYIYPALFFPSSPTAARAALITLDSGQQRDGIDLSLHPVRAFRVSGTIVGPDGPAPMVPMRLIPAGEDIAIEIESAATLSDGNGNFTILGATPGQYVIKAALIPPPQRPPNDNVITTQIQVGGSMMMSSSSTNPAPPPVPDDPSLFANVDVGVPSTDITGVIVTLQRGGRLTGHLVFEGTSDPPDASAVSRTIITIDRADSAGLVGNVFGGMFPPVARANDTGAFKTYGQAPGRYLLRIGAPPLGWTLKSATVEGRDISETPFDIGTSDINNVVVTFTDRPTKITGTVQGKDGKPDPDALVLAFPIDPAGWSESGSSPRRTRSARVTKTGTYTIAGLPPGDYYVAATLDTEWQDPQVLAELARSATTVRLSDGDTRTQNLVRSGSDR